MSSRSNDLADVYRRLVNILGDETGRPLVALIDRIAWNLDEVDDLRGERADPEGYPNEWPYAHGPGLADTAPAVRYPSTSQTGAATPPYAEDTEDDTLP